MKLVLLLQTTTYALITGVGAIDTGAVVAKMEEYCPNPWSYYVDRYEDLAGMSSQEARKHFINNGITEGRSPCEAFEPAYYVHRYDDLEEAFGNDRLAALDHWVHYGIKEGRASSPVFDPAFYLYRNDDLMVAFGSDGYEAALIHFLNHGIHEGRQGSSLFYSKFYLMRYEDMEVSFGTDGYRAALIHYLSNGIDGGRQGSLTFEPFFYLFKYDDLASAFGESHRKALEHFSRYGLAEGRQASLSFDPSFYLNMYDDLAGVYGSDGYQDAEAHFSTYGVGEGRRGSNEFDALFYLDRYGDLQEAFGYDYFSAAIHFLRYGIYEGRHGSAEAGPVTWLPPVIGPVGAPPPPVHPPPTNPPPVHPPPTNPPPVQPPSSEPPFEPVGDAPGELTWADIVDDFEDFDGNTGKVRVLYIDVDVIARTKAYKDDPYWWKFYRTFWDADGDFVNSGKTVEQGSVGRDCFGLDWYADATKEYNIDGKKKYSTRYCHPVSRKNSNEYCSVYMTNHYRGPINDDIRPGLDTRGPTYYDRNAKDRPGVNMLFEIHIDEYLELSRETFSCYEAGTWRNVKPGEVTADGYAIVPQSNEPDGSFPNPYFKWLFILPKGKTARLAKCKPGTCPEEPLTVTGYVRIVDPPLTAVSEEELFRRSLKSNALGGVDFVSMSNEDIAAEGFYFLVKVNGEWTRSQQPINFFDGKWNKNLDWITTCNCITLNGSGNHFKDGVDGGIAIAEELGRDFSIHYYMPTGMGYESYAEHNDNSRIPEMIAQIADWASDQNVQLDIRGHSWSSWLLWRACGEAQSKCSNVDLTTYAPATLPQFWDDIFYDMYDFKGNGKVVYGSEDYLSLPSLKNVISNTDNLRNVNFDRLTGTGHKLKDILKAHDP